MRSSVIHVTIRSPTNNIYPTNNKHVNPGNTLPQASTISTARYHRDNHQFARTGGKRYEWCHPPPQGVFVRAHDKFAKSTVDQNFGESVNNRIPVNNARKMSQYHQSSIQLIQTTTSWSNGVDFQNMHRRKSDRNKKNRYSPVCLCMSLLGLILLGVFIATILVPLIIISKMATTATTTTTTTTTTTSAPVWTITGNMSIAVSVDAASVLPSGKVLVSGGGYNGSTPINSAELYDPTTGNWTTTVSMNFARSGHTASELVNGNVLVSGGGLISTELYCYSSSQKL